VLGASRSVRLNFPVLRPNYICQSSGGENNSVNSGRVGLAMIHDLKILGQLEKLRLGLE
jgi:hypothetical protein